MAYLAATADEQRSTTWGDDVSMALKMGWEQLNATGNSPEFLYKLAPGLAAERRGITDKNLIQKWKITA